VEEWIRALITSLISTAAVVVVLGFLGSEFLKRRFDRQFERYKALVERDRKRRELTLKSQIEFEERQLSEFYGPIWAILKRGERIVEVWKEGRLGEIDEPIRDLLQEGNDQMVRIILTKAHLIDGDVIPTSFTDFLIHAAIWHAYRKTTQKGIPRSSLEFPQAYFPPQFNRDIDGAMVRLKRMQAKRHQAFGIETGK